MPSNREADRYEPIGKKRDACVLNDGDYYEDGFTHICNWSVLLIADGEYRLRDEAGWEYVGDVKDGKRDGLAVLRTPDGRRWAGRLQEGIFIDGVWRKSCGSRFYAYAYVYDGETEEGKPPNEVLALEEASLAKEQQIKAVIVLSAIIDDVSEKVQVCVTNTAGDLILDYEFTTDATASELEVALRTNAGYRPIAFFDDDGGSVSNSQPLKDHFRLTMKVLRIASIGVSGEEENVQSYSELAYTQTRRSILTKATMCGMIIMLIVLVFRGTGSDGDTFW